MRVIILEDEKHNAQKLQELILNVDAAINIEAVLPSMQACETWRKTNTEPDLVFCDIELQDGNVFDLLNKHPFNCVLIFTTAYDLYLQKAFDTNGIAYLLKPINYEKLSAALNKFQQLKQNFSSLQGMDLWKQLQQQMSQPQKQYKQRFAVKVKNGIVLLQTENIAYFQSDGGELIAFTSDGKKYFINETLQSLEAVLNPNLFFRINRSEMVNIDCIEKLEPFFSDRLSITLKGINTELIASASRTPELRKWIER